jgi:hypothetical protein
LRIAALELGRFSHVISFLILFDDDGVFAHLNPRGSRVLFGT